MMSKGSYPLALSPASFTFSFILLNESKFSLLIKSCVWLDLPSSTRDMASYHIIPDPPMASFTYLLSVYGPGFPSGVESAPSIGAIPSLLGIWKTLKSNGLAKEEVSDAKGRSTPNSLHLEMTSSKVL